MATTKTVAKTATKPAARAKAAAKPKFLSVFVLADIARPVSGERLYAHTFAAFSLLGMLKQGASANVESLTKLVGETAVKYHSNTKQNLKVEGDRIGLTNEGAQFFADRFSSGRCSQDTAQKFLSALKTGNEDLTIGVRQSNLIAAQLAA